MFHLGGAARANAGAAPASFTNSAVDLADPGKLIEFDGRIGAQTDAELAADADVRVDTRYHGRNLDPPRRTQRQAFRRGSLRLGHRVRNILGARQVPARKTPLVGVDTGASFGCDS